MQNLMNDLTKLFQKDDRIFADGKLLKNKLTELALKLDQPLVKLLLSDKRVRENFFIEQIVNQDKVLVFDKDKFISFVNNKEFLPDSFTSFKNKIGLMTNGYYLKEKNDVILAWAYKDCVLEGGQDKEDQKRNEIFYNEILARDEIDRLFEPKVLTNFKKYDIKGEHKVTEFNADDNLIIKGNNLLALHCLKKKYRGKVKLIYIDPPYNTESDSFLYNDKFSHSTFLTFLKNRFKVALDLLNDSGLIAIEIDNREKDYVKILCDEVFGRDNFKNAIIVKKGQKSLQKQFDLIDKLNAGYDTILLYSRKKDLKIPNLFMNLKSAKESSWNNHWRGTDRPTMRYTLLGKTPTEGQWRWKKERSEKAIENYSNLLEYIENHGVEKNTINDSVIDKYYREYIQENSIIDLKDFELVRLSTKGNPEHYIPATQTILLSENWMDLTVSGRITAFEHEKNEHILHRLIDWLTEKNDLICDFFMGSGTTCAVAHKMKRQYIGIEQIEYDENDSVVRLKNVIGRQVKKDGSLLESIEYNKTGISKKIKWQGGGSFIYAELMEWNEKYMHDIKDADTSNKLLNVYERMKKEAFFRYDIDLSKFDEKEFAELPLEEQKQVLCECLDKNHLYVNLTEIDDATYKVSADDKKFNKEFYRQDM